ncbi:hypothetical protein [Streptosporangium sp. NPDC049046]|uniref:hypothetical protein n=1 Tax=Streptosporangium sp. NPDC049046 TaxID=3155031 RepID=UPI00343496A6
MMRKAFAVTSALACALATLTACQSDEMPVDRSPMPTVAAAPYLCEHVPLKAVELMTGVRNPLVRGFFDLTSAGGLGDGSCAIYQREGEQPKVLQIRLTPAGNPEAVEEQIEDGALPLPEILPGVVGSYFKPLDSETNDAYALLVRGEAEISIQMEIGAEGRDNAADVLALMKLIAPKLLTDASAPSPTPKTSTPKED